MLTTTPLTTALALLDTEETQRHTPLLETIPRDGEIIATTIHGVSATHWLTSTPAQASLLLALNPQVDRAQVWSADMLIARLGEHTKGWTLEQLAAGLFARLGPEPRATSVPWWRRVQRWLRARWATLPALRGHQAHAATEVMTRDLSSVFSIATATLLNGLAQATHGRSLDQLDQLELDRLWTRADALVLAARTATMTNTPPKASLMRHDATPAPSQEPDRGHGVYL